MPRRRHMQHHPTLPCLPNQHHLQHYHQQRREAVDEETVGGQGAEQGLEIKPQNQAAEHHQRQESLQGEDRLLSTNTRYLTTVNSATNVAGTCRYGTQAPHAPPGAIAPTTRNRQDTLARGMPTTQQVVTTSGTSTMGTVPSQQNRTRNIFPKQAQEGPDI